MGQRMAKMTKNHRKQLEDMNVAHECRIAELMDVIMGQWVQQEPQALRVPLQPQLSPQVPIGENVQVDGVADSTIAILLVPVDSALLTPLIYFAHPIVFPQGP
ncbi:hypothetical protein Syun_006813 [Stephania yunnanensis]|uniref:Uncharacterized protein n=1 Tax=Stephania yunnanensis TaxID=152371 RepID=A0AAP0KZ05_9MAGN